MAIRLITPPAVAPITLALAKQHLRVDHTDDDALIQFYIDGATRRIDGENGWLGRALVTQTWELVLDRFPVNEIKIPLPPLQSVLSVKYDDTAGSEQTLPTTEYSVDDASEPAWILPPTISGWPAVFEGINSVRIRFTAGYPPTTDSPVDLTGNIPMVIKNALMLHVGTLYRDRESYTIGTINQEMPTSIAVFNLLQPWRVEIPFA